MYPSSLLFAVCFFLGVGGGVWPGLLHVEKNTFTWTLCIYFLFEGFLMLCQRRAPSAEVVLLLTYCNVYLVALYICLASDRDLSARIVNVMYMLMYRTTIFFYTNLL